MLRRRAVGAVAVVAALFLVPGPRELCAQADRRPFRVNIDGCVLPADCGPSTAVLDLVMQDRTVRFAVTRMLEIDGRRTGGSLLSDIRVRPVRVYGFSDITDQLRPGPLLRVAAAVYTGGRNLLIVSVTEVSRSGNGERGQASSDAGRSQSASER